MLHIGFAIAPVGGLQEPFFFVLHRLLGYIALAEWLIVVHYSESEVEFQPILDISFER